ncbi:tyrosine-type recombinase/integrase [Cellulomonas sp. 73-145]|uniref:tyrosine-type recombinase/integrase n=1 Tax=Cellulomonas sp. 73-145 TaxID=1895739 RepID=UPI001AD4CCD0|nr:tyrosine-type recombinase/integrase [Cellulomonas sp. 73-145]MBN9328088.1 tyrosine-type recombinase/integrase [Cellulomonas sp.]
MSTPLTPAWGIEIEAWRLALAAAGRPKTTIELRTYHLRRLASWAAPRGPWDLTLDDLIGWTGAMLWEAETRRSVRSSLRGFWRWAVLTGRARVDVAIGLPPITPKEPRPRPAPPAAVHDAIATADPRLRLMLRLANELGMRRGEVAQVHTDDLLADLVGWSLRVHGKGARERVVPLPDDLAAVIRRCSGFVFPGACEGHLSARWVGRLVSRSLPQEVTMHQLRHLAATELHDETHNLRLVQRLLGHASLTTTQRYVLVRDNELRAAVGQRSAEWAGVRRRAS